MKEKILKLLNSGVFSDIIVGIELSYHLDSQEFKELYGSNKTITSHSVGYSITPYEGKFIAFHRDDLIYHFTAMGSLYLYEKVKYPQDDCNYQTDDWISLNPVL